ncbi:peptidylprolyl isomerase [Rhodococcus sp. HNM0569]|uniref:peptidylprolyl isomerase n=1 Tax=Rhodococcus sp. HNM0569 TaxID=2716340 RepID=UPI00146C94DB|nr:peptidylprolyl isomerase [Rhodococcus sp. HNM0569]NLU81288.1 peptidylprolyl isomerase [Rhodococcus sp. HNM0569]
MKRSSVAVAAIGLALVVSGCSDDGDTGSAATTSANTSATTASATAAPIDLSGYPALPDVPAAAAPTVDCGYRDARTPAKEVERPAGTGVSTEGTTPVTLTTNQGPVGLELDRAQAPCTVESFVTLARQQYFDDTPCHRLTAGRGLDVLQCGDPSGRGTGGPGYEFDNEYPENAYAPGDPALDQPVVYPRGTVAMANAGPGTNGSQFFLVYSDSALPPAYTVFGRMTDEGLATVEKIAAAGTDNSNGNGDGRPNSDVTIESATVA